MVEEAVTEISEARDDEHILAAGQAANDQLTGFIYNKS